MNCSINRSWKLIIMKMRWENVTNTQTRTFDNLISFQFEQFNTNNITLLKWKYKIICIYKNCITYCRYILINLIQIIYTIVDMKIQNNMHKKRANEQYKQNIINGVQKWKIMETPTKAHYHVNRHMVKFVVMFYVIFTF